MSDTSNPIPTVHRFAESEEVLVVDAPSSIDGITLREYDMYDSIVGRPPESLDEFMKFMEIQAKKIQ